MKLLKPPETIVDQAEVVTLGGGRMHYAGRTTSSDVEIVAPDFEDPKSKVWDRLKYGTAPDLGEAYLKRTKIDRLEFPGYILHGVIPYEQKRTNIWEGCIYKCKIDHYEVI